MQRSSCYFQLFRSSLGTFDPLNEGSRDSLMTSRPAYRHRKGATLTVTAISRW